MPQHHGLLDAHGAKAAVVKVMQIRAANAAHAHLHQHLAGAHLAGVLFVQAQVVGGVDHEAQAAQAQGVHGAVSVLV